MHVCCALMDASLNVISLTAGTCAVAVKEHERFLRGSKKKSASRGRSPPDVRLAVARRVCEPGAAAAEAFASVRVAFRGTRARLASPHSCIVAARDCAQAIAIACAAACAAATA